MIVPDSSLIQERALFPKSRKFFPRKSPYHGIPGTLIPHTLQSDTVIYFVDTGNVSGASPSRAMLGLEASKELYQDESNVSNYKKNSRFQTSYFSGPLVTEGMPSYATKVYQY